MYEKNTYAKNRVSRRRMLTDAGAGLGMLAFAAMAHESSAAPAYVNDPLLPKQPHFAAKAKRVIHVFLNGGVSHVDTFDPKPELMKQHGNSVHVGDQGGIALGSPFEFAKHGECGMEISSAFSKLAEHADDLCLIRSMKTEIPDHEQAIHLFTLGDSRLSRPSMGSWTLYGLGTENQSLPGFVALCPGGFPLESDYWQSSFLPAVYQGTFVNTEHREVDRLLENIRSPHASRATQIKQIDLIQELNRIHFAEREEDSRLDARIRSMELAFQMQSEAADAFDVRRESAATRERYGDHPQGRQMLIARRLIERGVRFVQVWHGAGIPWDHHGNIKDDLANTSKEIDQPLGALLEDLKRTGLLAETLVICSGEFGRTPTMDNPGQDLGTAGRGHHSSGFSVWMAGGGVKSGLVYGATDELGFNAVEKPVSVHDLQATILALLGFDHKRLTYRYAGRDFRLTDIHGEVVRDVIA